MAIDRQELRKVLGEISPGSLPGHWGEYFKKLIANPLLGLGRDLKTPNANTGLQLIGETTMATATDVKIPHKLGRVPKGRIIIYQNLDATIWDVSPPDGREFVLRHNNASTLTIKLLVF